jgi:5,10-methylenetetrahydromethanopterin reductase
MVKFGIRLLGTLGNVSHLQKLASMAEKSGFDACWFAHDPFQPNSWVSSVAVASVTKKISIGFNIKPYTIDPSEIATFAAQLDDFSNGRAVIALGSHTEKMFEEWIGLKQNLVGLTRESVELVRGLLDGKIMEYNGKIFHWTKEAYLRFKPLRNRIPIYVPGIGKDMFRLSGEIGDGSLPMATPPESFDYPMKYIKEGIESAGRDPNSFDYVGLIWIYLANDGVVDKMSLKRIIAYFLPYLEKEMISHVNVTEDEIKKIDLLLSKRDYEGAAHAVSDKMLDLAVYGDTEQCIKRIEKLVKKGATSISVGGPFGKNPEQALGIIGKDIISYFKNQ